MEHWHPISLRNEFLNNKDEVVSQNYNQFDGEWRQSNSSKTFYKEGILKYLTTADLFGDFWEDIFTLKIPLRKDEGKCIKNFESHHSVHGSIVAEKSVSRQPEESGIKNYFRKVMLFNATPKVNLAGKNSKSKLRTVRIAPRFIIHGSLPIVI